MKYILELRFQLNIKDELPNNVRQALSDHEISDYIESAEDIDLIRDLPAEETEKMIKQAAEELGIKIKEPNYEDMVRGVEHEEHLRNVYKKLPELIPDIRAFVEHAFNVRGGKLPV